MKADAVEILEGKNSIKPVKHRGFFEGTNPG
jgi:hypothetical protein